MAFILPLDLEEILVNQLAGSVNIFVFLAMLLIAGLSARFQMPTVVFGLMMALFGIILAEFIGGLFVILIVIVGFAVFSIFSRVLQ